jgi:prepilin-type N-terminal cleavage/methylation domain-containing protein
MEDSTASDCSMAAEISHIGRSGYTLIELLVTMGTLGILLAVGLPHFDSRRQDVSSVTKSLIADLRLTRTRSIVGDTHFCLHRTSSGYQVRRLKQSGNSWVLDKTIKTVTLPNHVKLDSWYHFKFNTRGMQVEGTSTVNVDVWDDFGGEHRVSVWPSGQAYEEF